LRQVSYDPLPWWASQEPYGVELCNLLMPEKTNFF
jgi:hypothetical protein